MFRKPQVTQSGSAATETLTADYADNTDKSEDISESMHGGSFVMASGIETSLDISPPSIIGFPIRLNPRNPRLRKSSQPTTI